MAKAKKKHPDIGLTVRVSRYFADPEEPWRVLEVLNEDTTQKTYTLKSEKTGEVRDIYSVHTYRTTKMKLDQARQRLQDRKTLVEKIGRKSTK